LSQKRYDAVDALFDQTVTFQFDSLKAATKTIHRVNAKLEQRGNSAAAVLITEARSAIAAVPCDETQAISNEVTDALRGSPDHSGNTPKGVRRTELEQQWARFARENYAKAQDMANQADRMTV
jgi:hypothetical protein